MRNGRYSAMMSSETKVTHTSYIYLIAIMVFFLTTALICATNVHVKKKRLLRLYPYLLSTLLCPVLLLYPRSGELHSIIILGFALCLIIVAISVFVATINIDLLNNHRGSAIISSVFLMIVNIGALILCTVYIETQQTARQHAIAVASAVTLAMIIRFVYAGILNYSKAREIKIIRP